MKTKITKYIEIDAGHRVRDHGSKCRNLHGHRYKIEASCVGNLHDEGEQNGMVLDFSFLKEEMVELIDKNCDHALILYKDDLDLVKALIPDGSASNIRNVVLDGFVLAQSLESNVCGKIYLVDFTPTAENLAAHWYSLLVPAVERRSNGKASLLYVKVWETPTSTAIYPWHD